MSIEKYLAIGILLAASCAVLGKPSGLALSVAQGQTICRTEVGYDEDAARIPRVIKVLRCAAEPDTLCGPAPGAPCCGGSLPDVRLACAELHDAVLVSDTTNHNYTINVPVGCACIRHASNGALEIK